MCFLCFQGFVTGVGKGLVGTVTKPVIGLLDLTSEGASAFRELCRDSSRLSPTRYRAPRCVVGPGGLLPPYSAKQSEGQEYLYSINDRNYSEMYEWIVIKFLSVKLNILGLGL